MKIVGAAVLAILAAAPAGAQDQDLGPLVFVNPSTTTPASITSASAIQLYRVPIDYTIRSMDGRRWGISLSCPISISGIRVHLQDVHDAERLAHSLGVFAVVPGIGVEIPLATGLRIRPFAEVGLGRGTDRKKTEVLYGIGASVRLDRQAGVARLTIGGEANHRRSVTDTGYYEAHSTFEGGIDAQVPLGFSIAHRQVRGGGYVIARVFDDLVLLGPELEPVALGHQFEAGVSFSTAPALRIWKIDIPWVAVGYQSGAVLTGIRVYTSFPF
jgi:hypothetical protein